MKRLSIVTLIGTLVFSATFAGCEQTYREETDLIEEAESLYKIGAFQEASELYRDFLRLHPRSPYAEIASQRRRLIDREMDTVMGQSGMPNPVHVDQRGRGDRDDDDDLFVPQGDARPDLE